jgi:putative two-component system response regulator
VIESRDIVTGQHMERMSAYCAALAQAVGFDSRSCQAIGVASRLHDVGKIGVPDTLLLKEASLTDDERVVIERHCQLGHEILAGAQSEILQLAAEIALTHHEWFDGTGYPHRLSGAAIPLVGRIAAIADVFDALTSRRPYRVALSVETARAEMRAERGTHFDPDLLDLFLALEITGATNGLLEDAG